MESECQRHLEARSILCMVLKCKYSYSQEPNYHCEYEQEEFHSYNLPLHITLYTVFHSYDLPLHITLYTVFHSYGLPLHITLYTDFHSYDLPLHITLYTV